MDKTIYWVAHPDEIQEVLIIQEGFGDYNVKDRTRFTDPVRVKELLTGDEYFVSRAELFGCPCAAAIKSTSLLAE